jgi:hypothetical protein
MKALFIRLKAILLRFQEQRPAEVPLEEFVQTKPAGVHFVFSNTKE